MTTCDNFILSNPYPSYDEMDKNLNSRIDLSSEYGASNHNFCKKLYENFNDDSKFSEIFEDSKKILNSGGIQSLYCNIEIVRYYSPLSNCKDPELIKIFSNTIMKLRDKLN